MIQPFVSYSTKQTLNGVNSPTDMRIITMTMFQICLKPSVGYIMKAFRIF